MKKLTVTFADDMKLSELEDLLDGCIEFHLETIPDPVGEEKRVKPKRHISKIPGITTQSTVAEHYTAEGMFTKELAAKWLAAKGFAATSASPAISALVKGGFLEPLGNQKYKWIKSPT